MKRDSDAQPNPEEWDFSSLNNKEHATVKACLFYEYARESPSLRNLCSTWDEFCETHPEMNLRALWPFVFSGGCFPNKSWLKLSQPEMNGITPFFVVDMVAVKGLEVFVKCFCPDYIMLSVGGIQNRELLLKHPFGQWIEDNCSQSEIPSYLGSTDIGEADSPQTSPQGKSSEYFFAVIDPVTWKHYTNKQIGDHLKNLVADNRPITIPKPKIGSGKLKKPEMLAALRWLGAMRLMNKVGWPKARELAQLGKRKSFFYEANLLSNQWSAKETWRKAADRANEKMHELFPQIPPEELPVSFYTKGLEKE